jgi:hypothetical protein
MKCARVVVVVVAVVWSQSIISEGGGVKSKR